MNQVLPAGTARPDYTPTPLPGWVTQLREHQVTAVREIVKRFRDGADVVFLDAPVGSGKTLIAELVRRELMVDKALYICTDKALQQQVLDDFAYARVLKGRANYTPTDAFGEITCEDCTLGDGLDKRSCTWCAQPGNCPYLVARHQAIGTKRDGKWFGGAELAVLNTAYLLAAANKARTIPTYPLIIADECDLLENALTGFVEYTVPRWAKKQFALQAPGKGVRKKTLIAWLEDTAEKARRYLADNYDKTDPKERRRVSRFLQETRDATEILTEDLNFPALDDNGEPVDRMLRDYGSKKYPVHTLSLRPVTVDRWGARNLWRHGRKWLCMSGTIISAEEMADSLGLPLTFDVVQVPSTFPVENRPVILAPVANMTYRQMDQDMPHMVKAIEAILDRHQGRVLIHTTSYALAKKLYDQVDTGLRPTFTHEGSGTKGAALQSYLDYGGSVLFTPSLARGVDLADDKCEVQIIAKCPFPSLADKQVSTRMHMPGGQQWYAIQTVRDIVQMTGRGVRHKGDKCVTYILDQQFTRNVWGRHKRLFPEYFREAVDERADVRWML